MTPRDPNPAPPADPRAGTRNTGHVPVMVSEVVGLLAPRPGQTVVDLTAGHGGHAAELARGASPGGSVVLFDWDPANLAVARDRVEGVGAILVEAIRDNFASAPRRLAALGRRADTVLADLGFASPQMDDPARGLSFRADGPLDMRLDPSAPVTAADLVGSMPEAELARILSEYGEEPRARAVAAKLVVERQREPIQTTGRLAAVVRSVVRPSGSIDPATRTFQALRIAVNDEIGNLSALLRALGGPRGPEPWLNPGARVAIIAFHSLEDRLVKRAFDVLVRSGAATALTAGAQKPGDAEVSANPRSRSARLRAIRFVDGARSDSQGAAGLNAAG